MVTNEKQSFGHLIKSSVRARWLELSPYIRRSYDHHRHGYVYHRRSYASTTAATIQSYAFIIEATPAPLLLRQHHRRYDIIDEATPQLYKSTTQPAQLRHSNNQATA